MENSEIPAEFEDTQDLHLALMHRSLRDADDDVEKCDACGRHLLFGERVYECANARSQCELCHAVDGGNVEGVHYVHGPSFGRTIRIIDRRSITKAA